MLSNMLCMLMKHIHQQQQQQYKTCRNQQCKSLLSIIRLFFALNYQCYVAKKKASLVEKAKVFFVCMNVLQMLNWRMWNVQCAAFCCCSYFIIQHRFSGALHSCTSINQCKQLLVVSCFLCVCLLVCHVSFNYDNIKGQIYRYTAIIIFQFV